MYFFLATSMNRQSLLASVCALRALFSGVVVAEVRTTASAHMLC
jgi:hypothetical protein